MRDAEKFAKAWSQYRVGLLARHNTLAVGTQKAALFGDDDEEEDDDEEFVPETDSQGNKILYLEGPFVSEEERSFWKWVYGVFVCITAMQFRKQMDACGDSPVILRINSPGGLVSVASTMRALITTRRMGGQKITVLIDGMCASAATFVALAAEEVKILDMGCFMIHRASTGFDYYGYGNEGDMRRMRSELSRDIKVLQGRDKNMAAMYAKVIDGTSEDVLLAMKNETYYYGQEAVDAGYVDSILAVDDDVDDDNKVVAGVSQVLDFSARNVDDAFLDWESSPALVAALQGSDGRNPLMKMAASVGINVPSIASMTERGFVPDLDDDARDVKAQIPPTTTSDLTVTKAAGDPFDITVKYVDALDVKDSNNQQVDTTGVVDPSPSQGGKGMDEKELAKLQKQMDALRTDVDAQKVKVDDLTAERDAANTARDEAVAERDAANAARDTAIAEREAAQKEIADSNAVTVRSDIEAGLNRHVAAGRLSAADRDTMVARFTAAADPMGEFNFQDGVLAKIPTGAIAPVELVGTSQPADDVLNSSLTEQEKNAKAFKEAWDAKKAEKNTETGGFLYTAGSSLTVTIKEMGGDVYDDYKEVSGRKYASNQWDQGKNGLPSRL